MPQAEPQQAKIHEWTKEQVASASKPNFGKVFVTAPHLTKLIGDVTDKRLLELGCGNGYWLRLFKELGAAECRGVDHAPNQIEAANNWEGGHDGLHFSVGDITQPLEGLNGQYDVVFLEHVLLEVPSRDGLVAIFRNARRALRPDGKLVVSDLHPFAPSSRPANMEIPDDYNYFREASPFKVASNRVDGKTTYYEDCHWSLSDLTNAMHDAGFAIVRIVEPLPTLEGLKEYPEQLEYRLETPMAIMFEAVLTK